MAQLVPTLSRTMGEKLHAIERNIEDRLILLEKAVLSASQSREDFRPQQTASMISHFRAASNVEQRKGMLDYSERRSENAQSRFLMMSTIICLCPFVEKRGHESGCRLAFSNRKYIERRGSLRFFNYVIQFKVAIVYSRRSRLLDVEVRPNFTLRAICSQESPAFRLFLGVADKLLSPQKYAIVKPEQIAAELSRCLLNLQKLFNEGKAWPTDSLLSGSSLLHVGHPTTPGWYIALHYGGE